MLPTPHTDLTAIHSQLLSSHLDGRPDWAEPAVLERYLAFHQRLARFNTHPVTVASALSNLCYLRAEYVHQSPELSTICTRLREILKLDDKHIATTDFTKPFEFAINHTFDFSAPPSKQDVRAVVCGVLVLDAN